MNEVIEFLTANPVVCLATVDENNKPRVRPFQFMFEHQNRLYFCTNNTKDVFRQLQANPCVELAVSTKEGAWLRISGNVVFTDDLKAKSYILDHNNLVKSIYKDVYNPTFEVFYIEHVNAVIADFSGRPSRQFSF